MKPSPNTEWRKLLDDKLRELAAGRVVHPEAKLADDLAIDSLDRCELVIAIEDLLDITVPEEAEAAWTTVADVVAFCESQAGGSK